MESQFEKIFKLKKIPKLNKKVNKISVTFKEKKRNNTFNLIHSKFIIEEQDLNIYRPKLKMF